MTRQQAIALVIGNALATVGLSESPKGSNDGPELRKFLATTRFAPGEAWCAYAVQAWGTGALGALWPLPRTGDCDVLLRFARENNILFEQGAEGDLLLVLASQWNAVHVALALGTSGETVPTIEGNSNGNGSREGFEVAKRRARVVDPPGQYVCRFVRWANLLPASITLPTGGLVAISRERPTEVPFAIQIGTNTNNTVQGLLIEGKVYAPVRATFEKLHGEPATTAGLAQTDNHLLMFGGKLMQGTPIYRDGVAYLWVHNVADDQRLVVDGFDKDARRVALVRPVSPTRV